MFPIIKIRLIYVKRNLIKNIFSFGYPILLIYLFTKILQNSEKLDLFPELKTPAKTGPSKKASMQNNNPRKHPSKYFNLFDKEELEFITNGDFGIISNDDDLLNKFNTFAIENFCMNLNEYDFLNELFEEMIKKFNISEQDRKKIPLMKSLNCKVKIFIQFYLKNN